MRKYRIDEFIADARKVQTKEEARVLCETELEWIYTTFKGTTPHNVINHYRKALREENLWEPYLRRPLTIYEDGQPVVEYDDQGSLIQRYDYGYMRERQDHVKARFAHQHERLQERNTFSEDRELLVGRETRYLQEAKRLLLSADWLEVSVGLLMATGRRNFETGDQGTMVPVPGESHWVGFAGQAKKRLAEEREATHAIPVLVDGHLVCEKLSLVQSIIEKMGLDPGNVDQFDQEIGIKFRHAVERCLRPLFPTARQLSPRTLRNFYVSLALEGIDHLGKPLLPDGEDPERFIGRILGHKEEYRARDAYKGFIMQRQRRNIPLP